MSKRFNNKRLLYIIAGLAVILVLTMVIKVPREKSTLIDKLVEFDTASVKQIVFYPRISEGGPFEFVKENGKWSVEQKNIKSVPEKDAVQNILLEMLNIKPQSLAAVDKSKWKEFNLTDSLAIRIKLLNEKGKALADVMIGKFTYKPVSNPYARSGANNIQGTSYVRLYGEKEIYGVDGFLSFSFSGKFDDYRDKSFLRVKDTDVTRISFTFPSDSSFVLSRKDSLWYAGNLVTDSLNTASYLGKLRSMNGQEIYNNFTPTYSPVYQMSIEGNNLLDISVKCYKGEGSDKYILNSSLNPAVYFVSKSDGIFDQLFKPQSYFLKKSLNIKK